MKPVFLIFALAVASGSPLVRSAETLVVAYDHPWQYMNPMGANPSLADADFDTTWWLPRAEFEVDYNGPVFGIVPTVNGSPGNINSINSGSGPGPLGYGSVSNWNGANVPLLVPFGGSGSITAMGSTLTTPSNTRRYASYHRTTFVTSQTLSRPVVRCMIDDGAVIFLDGNPVAWVNLVLPSPSSHPIYTTFALGDSTPAPVFQETENTLLTFDLSVPGNQGTPGGLQANVVNPVSSLPSGEHTLAVFLCSQGASSNDQLLAIQITADDAGLNPAASNVVRNLSGTPTNPTDDTFEFDVVITQQSAGSGGWISDSPQHPAGEYGETCHFSGFPATGSAQITFHDADSPALSALLTVPPPAAPLWLGKSVLPGQPLHLLATPDSAPAWIQSGAESVQQSNGGATAQVIRSTDVPIPAGGATFSAILEFQDDSSADNFEANDTLEAKLVLLTGSGTTEVNLIPAALDRNSDGVLNGYSGPDIDANLAVDEFNLAARPAAFTWTEGCLLSSDIPPGTLSATFVVRAVNDHQSEVFRIRNALFCPPGHSIDRDEDGASDADELAAGTDPFNSASIFRAAQSMAGNTLTLVFPTVPARSYRVLWSHDMVNWTQDNQFNIVGDGDPRSYGIVSSARRKYIRVEAGRGVQPFP